MAFRDLFTRPAPDPAPRPAPAAGAAGPGYDPLLISQLQRDHRRLLDLFARVQQLLTHRDYAGVQRALGELRIVLQDHLLRATNRLYVFLGRRWEGDAERTAVINTVRRESLESGREILDALRTYAAVRLDDQGAEMFQAELFDIGTRLMQRMEREESTLFPLYRARR